MKIFVVGSGKLANALLNSGLSFPSCEMAQWETGCSHLQGKAIVVHAGSGRQLEECIDFCSRTKSVFIELATGLGTEKATPDFPLIICPNTSILVLKALQMVKANGKHFEGYDISITQSHQTTKTTEPGTAFAFADSLKFPHQRIESVRDPLIQQSKIGIPAEYLGKHAYHRILIKDGDDEVTIVTKVLGHKSYANGVKKIIEMVLQHKLENKKYTILELIGVGVL